ncbi:hypothetical protein [Brevibacillus porteri]|uniref:hypothetical protein n=1 Tax=Brevibacillus porteri TaxID=2126350 RepID=UPI003D205BC4
MIKEIQREINAIVSRLQLSMDSFIEDHQVFFFRGKNTFNKLDGRKLLSHLSLFNSSIEVILRYLTTIKITGNSTEEEQQQFIEWLSEHEGIEIQLSIVINKNDFLKHMFNNRNDQNIDYKLYVKPTYLLSSINYDDLERNIFSTYKHTIIFVPFLDFSIINNKFVTVIGNEGVIQDYDINQFADVEKQIKEKVKTHKLYCNSRVQWDKITPEHFYFPQQDFIDDYGILKALNMMAIKSSLHFIANVSDEKEFLIRGYKNIRIENSFDSLLDTEQSLYNSATKLFNLYNSIYEIQTQDKLLITRNVLTIYLQSESNIADLIKQFDEIFASIESNLDNYVKDKVKSFFDKKKDLEKYVRDTSEGISKQIATVSDNLSKSWLTLIGAIIAGVITYSTRGSSPILVWFFLLFGFTTFVVLGFSIKLAEKEKELSKATFDHFNSLLDSITEEEKVKIIGNVVDSKLELLSVVIEKLTVFRWCTLYICLVLTILFKLI